MLLKEESLQEYHHRLNLALDYLNEHLDEDISLDSLSGAAYFSPYHFHRIFSAIVGETPNDYARRLRLEKAANKLIFNPKLTVTEIAFDCGFTSSSVFARAFQAYFGISARKWRERNKNGKLNSKKSKEPEKKENYNNSMDTVKNKKLNTEIKVLPDYHAAYTRCLEGYNQNIGKAWGRLFRWAYPRELVKPETVMIGIPLDNPDITPLGKCRYYACLTVPQEIKPEGEISIMDIKGGKYAVCRFEGREEDINDAYHYLYGVWLPESGYQPEDRPALEIYSGIQMKKSFKYDICLPIKPL